MEAVRQLAERGAVKPTLDKRWVASREKAMRQLVLASWGGGGEVPLDCHVHISSYCSSSSRYELDKAAEAFKYLRSGRAKGKVVITIVEK